jgi:hypothetical protein
MLAFSTATMASVTFMLRKAEIEVNTFFVGL